MTGDVVICVENLGPDSEAQAQQLRMIVDENGRCRRPAAAGLWVCSQCARFYSEEMLTSTMARP